MPTSKFILRLGLCFVFMYAGFGSLFSPADWLWYIPAWIQLLVPATPLLLAHGFFQLFLGIWLLSGKKIVFAGLLAAAEMLTIVLINLGAFSVVFRDVGLLFSALALVRLYINPKD
jgi:uncharacterized membrane protein YphA (DoxX/SURF4 family)